MHKLLSLSSHLYLLLFLCVINTVAQEQQRSLVLNDSPIERELSGGQTHVYTVKLNANQIARVIAEQKGVDVVLSIIAPDGAKLFDVDSPTGSGGEEPAAIVARQ